jgi:hypothetical protein
MRFRTKEHSLHCGVDLHARKMHACAECVSVWHWLADLCHRQAIPFILSHALYMKVTHDGKVNSLSVFAHKLGRAVHFMHLTRGTLTGVGRTLTDQSALLRHNDKAPALPRAWPLPTISPYLLHFETAVFN